MPRASEWQNGNLYLASHVREEENAEVQGTQSLVLQERLQTVTSSHQDALDASSWKMLFQGQFFHPRLPPNGIPQPLL